MNVRLLQALRDGHACSASGLVSSVGCDRARTQAPGLSRRRFIQTAGGVVIGGATLDAQIFRPEHRNEDDDDVPPLPIPGGSPALGGRFHVYGPTPDGSFDPIDAEPSTITNFNGDVGLAYISGTVTRTQISTGARVRLPFNNSDMRFMKGVYRGVDGKPRTGAFALI